MIYRSRPWHSGGGQLLHLLHTGYATLPLPLTVSCFSKIQIGFTFLVLAYPGSPPPDEVPLNGCVCVCVCVRDDCRLAACVV